jgi:hypothetical protein
MWSGILLVEFWTVNAFIKLQREATVASGLFFGY